MNKKLLVLGLDGATWDILSPWMKKGLLPNITSIVDKGVSGTFKSTYPFVTWPAWKCYSTGKNPGKLNVFWWLGLDYKSRKVIYQDANSFKSKDYWDYIGKADKKVGVINMPSTFPPKPVNGFMISGGAPDEESNFTYPESLRETILKELNYQVKPKVKMKENRDEYVKEVGEIIQTGFKTIEKFIEDVEILHATIFYIDQIQHYFWKDMVEGISPYKNTIQDTWQLIDTEIGHILKKFPELNIILMSDHGFGQMKGKYNLNEWFEYKGYLKKNETIGERMFQFGITREKISTIASRIGIAGIIKRIIPQKIQDTIPQKNGRVSMSAMESKIDWENTKVMAFGEGPIYINPSLPYNEQLKLKKELQDELKRLKHPLTKERMIEQVFLREEIYSGKYLNNAPDMVAIPCEGYELATSFFVGNVKDKDYTVWSGNHRLNGIFAANGSYFLDKKEVNLCIYDLAPTILHMYKVPVPKDMDGRVRMEIFKSGMVDSHIEYIEEGSIDEMNTEETIDHDKVYTQLKGLGYID